MPARKEPHHSYFSRDTPVEQEGTALADAITRSLDHVIYACDMGVLSMWCECQSREPGPLKWPFPLVPVNWRLPLSFICVHHWHRSTLSARRRNSTSRRHDEIFRSRDLCMWHGRVIHVTWACQWCERRPLKWPFPLVPVIWSRAETNIGFSSPNILFLIYTNIQRIVNFHCYFKFSY